jgi:hypothetical protein
MIPPLSLPHSRYACDLVSHRRRSLAYGPTSNVREVATNRSTLPPLRNRP